MLDSLQQVDLFEGAWEHGISRIIGAVYRILSGARPPKAMHTRADAMDQRRVLYSTNTWLAYAIAEKYYNNEHYVWCTPFFSPRKPDSGNPTAPTAPPLSSPLEIYRLLAAEISEPNLPEKTIGINRAGILRGSNLKRQLGEISKEEEEEIFSIVDDAKRADYNPLVYVIPYSEVAGKVREPPPGEKAHPLSAEYIIDRLPRDCFDVIKLESTDAG